MDVQDTSKNKHTVLWIVIIVAVLGLAAFFVWRMYFKQAPAPHVEQSGKVQAAETQPQLTVPELDKAAYDLKLLLLANKPVTATSSATTALVSKWPVKTVYPNVGALLPFNRIVAYYGNLYSKNMGILGEYSEDEVLRRLQLEVDKWNKADPTTPVIPALHYIAVVAQAGPGKDGKYRARMPDGQIDKVLKMAEKINAVVFLDIQVGLSNVEAEIPLLEKYLKLPNVHLGIDPEFSMKSGARPGTEIGKLDARDVNFAAEFLAKVVRENNLTPKILIVHRFTRPMLTNSKDIRPLPEVQVVVNMDGFGSQGAKLNTYKSFVVSEPVQFTGFKLFYKNDSARAGSALLSPEQLLKLSPIPSYIQYQ